MNVDKLKDELLSKFRGNKLTANDLFEAHHTSNLYSRSHYTEALRRLVEESKINSDFTDSKTHKVTVLISRDCLLTFNN